eukprot:1015745-Prymnesium_polylepis.1
MGRAFSYLILDVWLYNRGTNGVCTCSRPPEPKGLVPLEDVSVFNSSQKQFAFTLSHDAADGSKLKSAKATKAGGSMQ